MVILVFFGFFFQSEYHTDIVISQVATMFDSEKRVANKVSMEDLFLLDKGVTIESVIANSIPR